MATQIVSPEGVPQIKAVPSPHRRGIWIAFCDPDGVHGYGRSADLAIADLLFWTSPARRFPQIAGAAL